MKYFKHTTLANLFWFVLLASLIALTNSCKNESLSSSGTPYVDSLVRTIENTDDSIPTEQKLHYIESAIANKQLSPEDRFKIYSIRQFLYQNKQYDYKHAAVYADSMLWLTQNYELKDPGNKKFSAHKQVADVNYRLEHYKTAYENYEIAKNDEICKP